MKLHLALALAALLPTSALAQTGSGTATYKVTFQATWSASSHPGAFPASAHFSGIVGGTHTTDSHLWQVGGLATGGIEVMAESGSQSALLNEVNAAITAGTAGQTIKGSGIGTPASTSQTFTVTDTHPAVSIVTMIAPSPDWFLGVDGVELLQNDDWVASLSVPLYAYDSGTDSGTGFTSFNQDTNPADPITLMTSGPFFGTTPLGSFLFERIDSVLEYGTTANPAGSLAASGPARIGQPLTFTLHDVTGTMAQPAASFLAISSAAAPGYPAGLPIPGWGLTGPGTSGDLLLATIDQVLVGPTWNGAPANLTIPVPSLPALVGLELFTQGVLVDSTPRIAVTSGLRFVIGS